MRVFTPETAFLKSGKEGTFVKNLHGLWSGIYSGLSPPLWMFLQIRISTVNYIGVKLEILGCFHFKSLNAVAATLGTCPFPRAVSLSTLLATP